MKVSDVMTPQVVEIAPSASVEEAAQVMERENVGCLVVSEKGKLRGILTDRDIVIRVVAKTARPSELSVQDIMTPNVIAIQKDADVSFALDLMRQHSIRRLPVLGEKGQVIGILSVSDVAWVLALDICNCLNLLSQPFKILRMKEVWEGLYVFESEDRLFVFNMSLFSYNELTYWLAELYRSKGCTIFAYRSIWSENGFRYYVYDVLRKNPC
ncbi:MAG: CBS domain-containing protein [bacterium JZ-2024 1]